MCKSWNDSKTEDATASIHQNCTYTTQGGVNLQATSSFDPETQAHNSTVLQTVVESQKWDGDLDVNLANLSVIKFGPQSEWHLPWPNIYTCEFSLCQKTFASFVVNGSLSDLATDARPLEFRECLHDAGPDHCPAFILDEVPAVAERSTQGIVAKPNAIWISTEAVTLMGSLIKTLLTYTNGNIGMERLAIDPNALMASMVWKLNNGDVTQTIDDITTAMTNQVREGPNSTWVEGKAWKPTVIVSVNWSWLSLPIAVLLLTFAFLFALIAKSADPSVQVWKLSVFGTVFHPLQHQAEENMAYTTLSEMDYAAKSMKVILRTGSGGRTGLCR